MHPETLAQSPLQHLAGAAFGQIRFKKLDAPGKFISCEASPAESNQIVGGQNCPWLQNYTSRYELAPLRIGYAEDGYFTNGRMPVDHCFHLSRINVLTAGNNHVLKPVEDVKVSRSVLLADISRTKESVTKRFSSFFRIVPITTHDVGATCDQFTCLSRIDLSPCRVCYLKIHTGTGPSAGHELVFRVLLVLQAREKACFAQPIHLNQFDIRQQLACAMDQFRRHR